MNACRHVCISSVPRSQLSRPPARAEPRTAPSPRRIPAGDPGYLDAYWALRRGGTTIVTVSNAGVALKRGARPSTNQRQEARAEEFPAVGACGSGSHGPALDQSPKGGGSARSVGGLAWRATAAKHGRRPGDEETQPARAGTGVSKSARKAAWAACDDAVWRLRRGSDVRQAPSICCGRRPIGITRDVRIETCGQDKPLPLRKGGGFWTKVRSRSPFGTRSELSLTRRAARFNALVPPSPPFSPSL
ncbi:hypothetical protein CDD83_3056 [Cordyceps sp. RAO-2017]|nr:hypothetical protein CDD83_3056 [Cordyceps sp. RAO-2017]